MSSSCCVDCGAATYKPKGRRHPSALCSNCFPKHKDDLIEIIYPDGTHRVFSSAKQKRAEKLLQEMGPIRIRLDLHGVADLLDMNQKVPDSICFISFVGKYSDIRFGARKEIKERLANGQGSFGILVFRRGGNAMTEPGSKAWVNAHIPLDTPLRLDGKSYGCIFIDDGEDHYKSVRSLRILGLFCYYFHDEKNKWDLLRILCPYNFEKGIGCICDVHF